MAKINLLPWRDELREQRKKKFVAFCVGVAALGVASVFSGWVYFDLYSLYTPHFCFNLSNYATSMLFSARK